MIQVKGQWLLPNSMKSQAKKGFITTKRGWKRVFNGVEQRAMGPGGVLEKNLVALQAEVPLQPSTVAQKARKGLPATPLVGKKKRILKAVRNSVKTYRKRAVFRRRKGGYGYIVRFNPSKFRSSKGGDPYTRVLQNGRLLGFRGRFGQSISTSRQHAAEMSRSGQIRLMRNAKATRSKGWPIMSYRRGNERQITPALTENIDKEMARQIQAQDKRRAKAATT
jgi:hypothetical protein